MTSKNALQMQITTPAWCRKALRLLSHQDSVKGAVIGLKKGSCWATFAFDAEDLSTDEIIQAFEHVSGSGRSTISCEISSRAAAGAPLRDPEGGVVGALLVFAESGAALDASIESILAELAGLVSPFASVPAAGSGNHPEPAIASDPAFMVRVFGRIQPLVSEIVGFSDVLRREVIGTSRNRAGIIHRNASRVVNTLRSALDLLELEAGTATRQLSVTDMNTAARHALGRHRSDVRKRGLGLEFRGTDDLVEAHVDETAVQQILDILLVNAVQYTDEGSITIIVDKTTTEARITVRDTGRGIPKESMPKLFEPFYSGDSGSPGQERGMGLGLAVARRLAAQIHAKIVVDSEPGKGSDFTLVAPLASIGGDSSDVPEASVDVRHDLSDKPLLLFVEDNAVARRVIGMMVGNAYELICASTVDEALEHARAQQFDLLLLDIALNERRTGVELLQDIRSMERYRDVPAVACTAHSLPGLREQYLKSGFDEYIAKPFRAEQLLDLLNQVRETGRRDAAEDPFQEEIDIELPPLPGTLPKMLELISGGDDAVGAEEVTLILKADPVATSWVLGHVNSAFYSVRGQVTTVDRAVTLLGGEPICNLVVAGLLARTFKSSSAPEVRRVHEHIVKVSLATAGFARELSAAVGMENPELAFTAGVMHDIGRMCLLAHDGPSYAKLWIDDDGVWAPELGQELIKFGIDHVSLGAKVSRKWSLPPEIRAVIENYEKADHAEAQHRSLASVVAVARAAALELMEGESTDLERVIQRLEAVYEAERGSLLQVVRERAEDVNSLIDSVRLD